MRMTLQAAADGKFPLYNPDGSTLTLSPTDRDSLVRHAAIAEQQNKVRWWMKGRWKTLQAVLVGEVEFWQWLNDELDTTKAVIVAAAPTVSPARTNSGTGAKSRGIDEAIDARWPGGIPNALSAKDRNRMIVTWLVENKRSVPQNPERAIQRALARRRATKRLS
jgi:hypothetical protein